MLAVGINGTAIMTALPSLRAELGLGAQAVTWAVNAYLLTAAACIILGGTASDRLGPARVALAGLLLFAAASGVIALAEGPAALLVGRALQGLGAALAVPGTLAAIGRAVASEARGAALGAWAVSIMLGFSLGPLLGGAITEAVGWRFVFWFTGSLLLAAAAGLFAAGREAARFDRPKAGPFDGAGFALLATAMVAFVLALDGIGQAREAPLRFAGPVIVAAGAFALFRRTERARAAPFVDLAEIRAAPDFRRAVLVGAAAMFCILPTLLFFNLAAQQADGLGLTPVGAGLALLPLSAGLLAFALLAPRLVRRFAPSRVVAAGLCAVAASALLVALGVERRAEALLAPALFLFGAGLALPYALAPRLALAALPAGTAGRSSGLINAGTFLGGSLGITCGALAHARGGLMAVLGVVAAAALAGALAARRLPAPDEPRA
ncbi:MFS transporter [Methylobacterium sp. A54F]